MQAAMMSHATSGARLNTASTRKPLGAGIKGIRATKVAAARPLAVKASAGYDSRRALMGVRIVR